MRLVQELRAKGVDAETAREAIGEVLESEEVSELELAREVVARWSPRSGEEPLRARRRLYGLLARRGFGGETVRQVMEELEL
jgi:regulatory protein